MAQTWTSDGRGAQVPCVLEASRRETSTIAVADLSDLDLERLAREYRAAALSGSREARGPAHLCEVELRRRRGVEGLRSNADLDLRSLEERSGRR